METLEILKEFLEETYTFTGDRKDYIRLKDLYDSYTSWCISNDISTFYNRRAFTKKLDELGIGRKRSNEGYRYLGLRKKDEENTFLYDEENAEEKDTQDFSFNLSIKNNAVQINIEIK